VGPYTAAAISYICFKKKHAVVDGNVYRVLSRYFNIDIPINSTEGKKIFEKLAQKNLHLDHPGDYNQSIMEFGARMCVPVNPDCNLCPLHNGCGAFEENRVHELPVKLKKLKVKDVFLHYFLFSNDNYIYIEKRDHSGIWKGLYHLPLIETKKPVEVGDILSSEEVKKMISSSEFIIRNNEEVKHKLTHRNLHIRFYNLELSELNKSRFIKIKKEDWKQYAFPKPIVSYLSRILN
jgi:A/G-specific adenine glycosylase